MSSADRSIGLLSGSSGRAVDEQQLEPTLDFSLSDGTVQQILTESGLSFSSIGKENSKSLVQPVYFGELTEKDAAFSHTIAHSLAIETETLHLLPNATNGNMEGFANYAQKSDLNSHYTCLADTSQLLPTSSYVNQIQTYNTSTDNKVVPDCAGGVNTTDYSPMVYGSSLSLCNLKENFQNGICAPSVSPVVPFSAATDFPCNTINPGAYQFEFIIPKPTETESKKTIAYRYLSDHNKLFVRTKVNCPIQFTVQQEVPGGSRIRAMVIYSRPQDVGDVVKRCMNHSVADRDNINFADHFLRCHNGNAVCEESAVSGRQSVVIPWEPNSGEGLCTTGLFEFMCFTSCTGAGNRRNMQLVFTLEYGNGVYGRQVVDLKVCACPGRDAQLISPTKRKQVKTEEKQVERVSNFTTVEPIAKKSRNNEIYTVQVRGRELYKIVTTIIRNYELSRQYTDVVNKICPSDVATVRQSTANEDLIGLLPDKITQDTEISCWLSSMKMNEWSNAFEIEGMKTIEDLDGRISVEKLEKMGMNSEESERLYGAYVQWKSINEPTVLSSLSTVSGIDDLAQNSLDMPSLSASNSQLNSPHGYRVSKTTVRHLYKLPKQRNDKK